MIEKICPNHGVPFEGERCPKKGCDARPIVTTTTYWCEDHKIPLFEKECPICNKEGKYLSTDVRPVFPEEKLLLAILTNQKSPLDFDNKAIWCSGNGYFVDGIKLQTSVKDWNSKSLEEIKEIKETYDNYVDKIDDSFFKSNINAFVQANKDRYNEITDEAIAYIQSFSDSYSLDDMFVSFSGGKDSTVTSDLVTRAFSTNAVTHIFGDTTL